MKKIGLKVLSVLLLLVMAVGIIPLAVTYNNATTPIEVSAASYTTPVTIGKSTVLARIGELQDILGGKYFTTDGKICNSNKADRCKNSNIIAGEWFKSLFPSKRPSSYKQFPIHYASTGSVTQEAWSCAGFGNFAMWYIFASKSTDDIYVSKVKTIKSNKENFEKYAMPGDIIRVDNTHTAIFISAGSSKITVLDSNWNETPDNKVRTHEISYTKYSQWTISRAKNYNTEENTLTINYHINGATALPTYKMGKATDLRSSASAKNDDNKLLLIPKGAKIVAVEEKEAENYTWARTTYDEQEGWCVLEDATRRFEPKSGIMYKYSSTQQVTTVWAQGTGDKETGLYNAKTLGLIKTGYKFAGWCKDSNGDSRIFDQDDKTLIAEDIEPTVTSGSKSITLYAIWEPDCAQGNHVDSNGAWEHDATSHYYTCSCGVTFNAANHSGGTATCISQKVCTICGIGYGDTLGHNFENSTVYAKDENGHSQKCNRCNAYSTAVNHNYGSDNVCDDCGYDKTVPHTHSYTEQVAENEHKASEATCAAKATYYKSCSCGANGAETFESGEKNMNSHIKSTFTCTDNANGTHTKAYECCGTVVTTGEVHSFGEDNVCDGCGYEKVVENDTESGSENEGEEGPDEQPSVGDIVANGCVSVVDGGMAALITALGCGFVVSMKRKKNK